MIGAALEAELTAMCELYVEEIRAICFGPYGPVQAQARSAARDDKPMIAISQLRVLNGTDQVCA